MWITAVRRISWPGDGIYRFFFTTAGVLSCLDGYMNIALEQTEEHANGRVTNRYGDAFIRGNNGASLFCLQDVLF